MHYLLICMWQSDKQHLFKIVHHPFKLKSLKPFNEIPGTSHTHTLLSAFTAQQAPVFLVWHQPPSECEAAA